MPNTELERRIRLSWLHDEDVREIRRIFEILSDAKKQDILDRWNEVSEQIRASRRAMEEERELLLSSALAQIERDIEEYNRHLVWSNTQHTLSEFKKNI